MVQSPNSASSGKKDRAAQALNVLQEGIQATVDGLKKIPEARKLTFTLELDQMAGFLDSFVFLYETMPEHVVRGTLLNSIRTILKKWPSLPSRMTSQIKGVSLHPTSGLPEYVHAALTSIGPAVRLSHNEMKAWITVDKEFGDLLTSAQIMEALRNSGVTVGILEDEIHNLFEQKRFNEEILVAKGKPPNAGKNGFIRYCIKVDDLGKTPKLMEDGRVSYKDIRLFEYVSAGDRLAEVQPAVPGKPGATVTERPVYPVEVYDAVIPKIKYTEISEDQKTIRVTEDCCVTKQLGTLHLEPTVRVDGSVSYASGNIDSNVSVLVTKDVNTGFSIRSKKDIVVEGIVEGAELYAGGNITVKGGIQGKDKAKIEAGGEVHTKLISHASVNCVGDLVVAHEIINATILTDGRVVVAQKPAQIIGGTIQADVAVIADVIGSDMEVPTVIRLGGRSRELQRLVSELEAKIEQEETRLRSCEQILQQLESQLAFISAQTQEIETAHQKAQQMQTAIHERIHAFYQEQEDLMIQLEESNRQPRAVTVKKQVWTGTKILMSEKVREIHESLGPSLFVWSGEEISRLPYSSE